MTTESCDLELSTCLRSRNQHVVTRDLVRDIAGFSIFCFNCVDNGWSKRKVHVLVSSIVWKLNIIIVKLLQTISLTFGLVLLLLSLNLFVIVINNNLSLNNYIAIMWSIFFLGYLLQTNSFKFILQIHV